MFFHIAKNSVENYQSVYKWSNSSINPADKSNCMRFVQNERNILPFTIPLFQRQPSQLIILKSSARWICWRCCVIFFVAYVQYMRFAWKLTFVFWFSKKWLVKYNPIVSNRKQSQSKPIPRNNSVCSADSCLRLCVFVTSHLYMVGIYYAYSKFAENYTFRCF